MNIIDDVIPAGSLGGFQIREELNVYSENLIEFYNQGQLSYEQTGIWSVRYSFETHPVEVSVDIRSGLVFKISALAGYKGKYGNFVGIGTVAKELFDSIESSYYDDLSEAILVKSAPGIAFEPLEPDPLPEDVPNISIGAITVFDPDLFLNRSFCQV